MKILDSHKKYLRKCLSLAYKGKGKTFPNPLVGCVIVKNNEIIGQGYHKEYGFSHAEVEAINSVKDKKLLKGATLYANLEPCVHWGKTPPCVDSIIKYGIKEVVCSNIDPNPLVNGRGIKKLESSGIKCIIGILSKEAEKLNKGYFKWIETKMPYVTIKSAMTLDGKIATKDKKSKWISSEKSLRFVHRLRSRYDAILVGLNTLLIDNPSLTTHGMGRDPVRIILGDVSKIKSPFKYKVFCDGGKTIVFTNRFHQKIKDKFQGFHNVKIVELKNIERKERFFSKVIKYLPEFNIGSVLIEGGGETIWSAINSKIVDDFVLFLAPKIFGGRNAKTFVEGDGVKNTQNAFKVKFESVKRVGDDIMLEGRFVNCKK